MEIASFLGLNSNAIKKVAVYRYPINDDTKRIRFGRIGSLNIINYIEKKSNRNLLVTGVTGQGKSKLMRLILEMMPNPKTIFSYKEGDEYLQINGNMIFAEKSLPNPFTDHEAFTNAFAVAFNISSEGIQASTALSIVNSVAKESSSWKEFISNAKEKAAKTKDSNAKAATNYLLQKIEHLTYRAQEVELDLDKTNILDLSYLNDEAKIFYSELFLRQIYKQVRARGEDAPKVIVCVDEAHRLTRNASAKHESIISEMSREIRAFGMLWTATQNFADIPDSLRNQFATQLAFSTTAEADLRAMSLINRDLAVCVSSLKKHEFVDAKDEEVHKAIAIYRADISGLAYRKLSFEGRGATASRQEKPSELEFFKPPEDRPTPTIHATLLTIYANNGASLAELVKAMKKSGFVTSDPTLYGAKGRRGVFEMAVILGLAKKLGKGYELTDKGLKWVEANKILENGQNLGSDLHKQILKRTITYLHEQNMLVIIPAGKETPDVIAYPVDNKKKYLWKDTARMAFEIQTTARKENILLNAERNLRFGLPICWVTNNRVILEEIKKLTENKDKYIILKW